MGNLQANFSFLTSGPGFKLQVPEDFDTTPELSSPILNGHGGRRFDYVPASRDVNPPNVELVRTLQDRDGRLVELYFRLEPPPLWWLRWHLTSGFIYSHLREEDGEGMADVTVKSLSIVESPEATPVLLMDPPLGFAASAVPDYEETAVFSSPKRGPTWGITLQRPGFLKSTSIIVAPTSVTGGIVNLAAAAGFGLDVRVWSDDDVAGGKELVSMVQGSLTDI